MKACIITFSLSGLLEQLGLEHADQLTAYHVIIRPNGNLSIGLTGDHPDLPEVIEGQGVPEAVIQARQIQSHIKVL